jgi:hypothetical protein
MLLLQAQKFRRDLLHMTIKANQKYGNSNVHMNADIDLWILAETQIRKFLHPLHQFPIFSFPGVAFTVAKRYSPPQKALYTP